MARPRFLSQFVASVIDNNTAVTQFRIADNGIGVLRQPQIEVDELLNMDLFVPATDTTSGAGTFNQSLLDKAYHREETGNYLVIVKTDNPCHIAVSNGLNYGDAWNQTSGVYNNLIKSTDALTGGFGFASIAANDYMLTLPDNLSAVSAAILLDGTICRIYKYTGSTGLYSPLTVTLQNSSTQTNYGFVTRVRNITEGTKTYGAFDVVFTTEVATAGNNTWSESVVESAWRVADGEWAADDRIAYSIESINHIYGNLLVMKCDNPINLSIINTSALDVAGKVYLLKVIDELE